MRLHSNSKEDTMEEYIMEEIRSDELRIQQEGMQKYNSYRNKIAEAKRQLSVLEGDVSLLTERLKKENQDVEELRKSGLHAFYLKVLGKYEKTMDKEILEAAEAKVKLENKMVQADEVRKRILYMQDEQREYSGCERRYRELYEKKLKRVESEEGLAKGKILECRVKITESEHRQKELREAITAGNRVLSELRKVESSLDSAEDYGTWDILGGGAMATYAKHSELDTAKSRVAMVQRLMRDFKTELADVKMSVDIQIDTDGFGRFADFFFDGLFADMAMQNKIHDAQRSVDRSKDKVFEVVRTLQRALEAEIEYVKDVEEQIVQIVVHE